MNKDLQHFAAKRQGYLDRAVEDLSRVMDRLRSDGYANEFVVAHAPTIVLAARLDELAAAVDDMPERMP